MHERSCFLVIWDLIVREGRYAIFYASRLGPAARAVITMLLSSSVVLVTGHVRCMILLDRTNLNINALGRTNGYKYKNKNNDKKILIERCRLKKDIERKIF